MKSVTSFCFLLLSLTVAGQSLPKLEAIAVNPELTFWAISAVDDRVAWITANKGTIGRTIDGGKHWTFSQVKGHETREFRSIYAFDSQIAIVANVGTPAHVLKTVDGGEHWSTVFQSDLPEAFIDGIDFWNENDGVVYGDPVKGRMFIIRTSDQGEHWDYAEQPTLAEGEASFASSGTGIRCVGDNMVVIATGGLASRLLTSADRGKNWRASDPMLRQGSKTGGIFSISFLNEKVGVLVGGDFADSLANDLARYTTDGGKSWMTPKMSPQGTRWCAEFISESMVAAVGPSGGDVSLDRGESWRPLFSDKEYHVIRKSRKGNLVVVAGSKGKLALLK